MKLLLGGPQDRGSRPAFTQTPPAEFFRWEHGSPAATGSLGRFTSLSRHFSTVGDEDDEGVQQRGDEKKKKKPFVFGPKRLWDLPPGGHGRQRRKLRPGSSYSRFVAK